MKNKTVVEFGWSLDEPKELQAFFPEIEAQDGFMECYAHIGQHSYCCTAFYQEATPATEEEYKDLLKELEDIGYDLEVKELHSSEEKDSDIDSYEDAEKEVDEFMESKKTKSNKKSLKENTPNFRDPADGFPLLVTGMDEDEDEYLLEDTIDLAKDLIDDLSVETTTLYAIELRDGYYQGVQIDIQEDLDKEYLLEGSDLDFLIESVRFSELTCKTSHNAVKNLEKNIKELEDSEIEYQFRKDCEEEGVLVKDVIKEEWELAYKNAKEEIFEMFEKLEDGGWFKLGIDARFSNGETWYSKIK